MEKKTKKEIESQKVWDKRYMNIVKEIAGWSTCVRNHRQVGSLIVRDNRILATGYNGALPGEKTCMERGGCLRNKLNIQIGTRQEVCYTCHGEQNAMMQAAKNGVAIDGATLYVNLRPCVMCTRLLISAGIKRVVYANDYPDELSLMLLKDAGIEVCQVSID